MDVCRNYYHVTTKQVHTNLVSIIVAKILENYLILIQHQLKSPMRAKVCLHYLDSLLYSVMFLQLDNSLNETLPLPPTSSACRRQRSSFTSEQLEMLEQFFSHTIHPDITAREYLARQLNIDENRVHVWFSNRRARTKKSTANNENQLPTSSDTDIKPYPTNEPVFDSTISTCR